MKNVTIGAEVELSDQELDSVTGGVITDGTRTTFRGFEDIKDGTSNTILVGSRTSVERGRSKAGFLRWFFGSR